MYTLIYWINKVAPVTAGRLADYFFPVAIWEVPHDLSDEDWAQIDNFEAAQEEADYQRWADEDPETDCMACLEPDRYDDHLCTDLWLI